jgi:hypothetical protein
LSRMQCTGSCWELLCLGSEHVCITTGFVTSELRNPVVHCTCHSFCLGQPLHLPDLLTRYVYTLVYILIGCNWLFFLIMSSCHTHHCEICHGQEITVRIWVKHQFRITVCM